MSPSQKWLIAAVVLVILEILPPATHFIMLCLAFGALAASIVAHFFAAPWLPWVTFVVCSAVLYPFLVPLAKFLFTSRSRGASNDTPPAAL